MQLTICVMSIPRALILPGFGLGFRCAVLLPFAVSVRLHVESGVRPKALSQGSWNGTSGVCATILWQLLDLAPFAVQRSHQAAGREVFDVTSEPQKTKGHRPTETIHLKTVI